MIPDEGVSLTIEGQYQDVEYEDDCEYDFLKLQALNSRTFAPEKNGM